ncbi:hypothetical protein ACFY1C_36505 [Streptomyces sp. NPDC001279]|uniref:hypothetical protein n=1 Tax=Streptomyces sp. NPDC001279 TaxID=3364556 RepID=UPI00367ACC2E
MLSMEEASRLAAEFLKKTVSSESMPMALVEGEHAHVESEIMFDCQSVAFIRSGDPRDMAIGIGYVAVNAETGECRLLGAVEAADLDLF